jgi:isoquinoline 1-oxidoreductase beta subunit
MTGITRRALLITGALLGGGLAIGVVFCPDRLARRADGGEGASPVTWLRILPDDTVIVLVPHVEMGQGTHTALAMMLAEELDAEWDRVRVEQAPAESMFATGDVVRVYLLGQRTFAPMLARRLDMAACQVAALMDMQITGGSLSVRSTGQFGMRRAGAAAREMLVAAAAGRWRVPAEECRVERGRVAHAASGRSAGFGALAAAAAGLPPPRAPQLKARSEYRLCGGSPALVHASPAVRGSLVYACDVPVPGALHAAVLHVPVFGGGVAEVDDAAVARHAGIRDIARIPGAVVVTADSYWRAERALADLRVRYTPPPRPVPDSAGLEAMFDELLSSGRVRVDYERGSAIPAADGRGLVHECTYAVPFLAHATMEPMNCTAWWHDGRLELWVGTQDPLGTRAVAARIAGLPEESVTVHARPLGGGFGRRTPGSFNYVEDAVHAARALPYPVRLQWSREEDLRHDRYRPAGKARLRSVLGAGGAPVSWSCVYTDIGYNQDRGAARIPYEIPNQRIGRVTGKAGIPLGYWRSVEHSYQGFFTESFIDELAWAAGSDPLAYRMRLLDRSPRERRVLARVADMIGWGRGASPGNGLGLALKACFGALVAEAVEVAVHDGEVRVLRVCAAVDAGEIVHPDNARAQLEGGILFGLSAALYGAITLSGGRVREGNFDDYPIMTMAACPDIDVAFIDSDAPMGGIGEVGVPPAAAALCNAIHAATGVRLRRLPVAGRLAQS